MIKGERGDERGNSSSERVANDSSPIQTKNKAGGFFKFLQKYMPEVFGITPRQLLHDKDDLTLQERIVLRLFVRKICEDVVKDIQKNHIKSLAIVSHYPGITPRLMVTYGDGTQHAAPLDGPALYSLHRQLLNAIRPYLTDKKAGG